MEVDWKHCEKQLESEIQACKRPDISNLSYFIDEKDSDVSFLTKNTPCVYCDTISHPLVCMNYISNMVAMWAADIQHGSYEYNYLVNSIVFSSD